MKRILPVLLCFSIVFGCSTPAKKPIIFDAPMGESLYAQPVNFDGVPAVFDNGGSPVVEFNIPASEKPTTIYVRKTPRKLFPSRKEPAFQVATDNPTVVVTQEPKTPWWWWALLLLFLAVLGRFVLSYAQKRLNIVTAFWDLVSRFWRKR